MKLWPIYKDNQFFGEYPSWWRSKILDIDYWEQQGETFFNRFEKLLSAGGSIALIAVAVKMWFDWTIPWKWALGFGIGMKIIKILWGILDVRYIKFGQATSEYSVRKRLSPVSNEQLDRIKNIEKKIAPETYKEDHLTYLK